jgi:hypothetical protein
LKRSRLGRWQREVRIGEQRAQQRIEHSTRRCPRAAVVERSPDVTRAPVIHQRVARPAVEPERRAVRPQHRQVADATQVQHGTGLALAAEHHAVEGRRKWSALASGRDVAGAEVADHVDSTQLGEQRGLVQLQGVAGAVELLRTVSHGLAVRADGDDRVASHAGRGEQFVDRSRVGASERIPCERRAMQFVHAGAV